MLLRRVKQDTAEYVVEQTNFSARWIKKHFKATKKSLYFALLETPEGYVDSKKSFVLAKDATAYAEAHERRSETMKVAHDLAEAKPKRGRPKKVSVENVDKPEQDTKTE